MYSGDFSKYYVPGLN